MKKLFIILLIMFLIGCTKKENIELKLYQEYIKELKNVKETSSNIPFDIEIKVREISEELISYTALINRNDLVVYDIECLIIHDKNTDNIFPSIGIFENKISLDNKSQELGLKLTGYLEYYNDIKFKLLIKYKDENYKEHKYYYIYNYRQ